jgi:hypothetical protein
VSAPACLHVPPGVLGSYVDEVGEVMEMAGRPLDPHQLLAVEALTSYTRGGKWPTFVAGVEGPRQTVGKTGGILLPIALTLCLTFVADERTWTAHRLDTTSKTFTDARKLLGVNDPDRVKWHGPLAARVRNVGLENGNEHIEFVNGSVLWFKARSGRAGRGLSGHDVFADELLYADDAQFEALLPTLATRSAQGSPRLWTGSSSALATSSFLRRLRARAVAADPGVVYVGWWARGSWKEPTCKHGIRCMHVAGSDGCALDDPARRHEANPGLEVRTSMAFLDEMRGLLTPIGFGREFLGWEEVGEDEEETIPVAAWNARKDETSRIVGRRVVSVDIAPDRRTTAIAGAGLRADGAVHAALTAYRPGTGWAVGRLLELIDRHEIAGIVVDGGSPAAALLPDLKNAGLTVRSSTEPDGLLIVMGAREVGQAYGGLYDGIAGDAPHIWHRGDPLLTTALNNAVPRSIGDGGKAFGRRSSTGDICPIVAVAQAVWGLSTLPPEPDYPLEDSVY